MVGSSWERNTRLRGLGAQAGSADPDALAAQLLLLMDGAFVASRMFRDSSPAHVGPAAAAIIKSATRRSRSA